MKKKIGLGVMILVIMGAVIAYMQYNKPHRDVHQEEAAFQAPVDNIFQEFTKDEATAYSKYHQQVIVMTGVLGKVDRNAQGSLNVLLEGSMGVANCEMHADESKEMLEQHMGKEIMVKGLFVGFDDLLQEIQLKDGKFYSEEDV